MASNWDLAYEYGTSALTNLGNTMSAVGQAKTDKANAKIAKLNKERMNANYNAAINEMNINKSLNLASNRMDYILSGFKVGTGQGGSTDLVQRLTAATFDADIDMLKYNQSVENKIYDRTIKSYKDAAKASKQQSWVSGIMTAVETAATIALLI